MPAAAVIPAPIAYTKVVAVKKLVVQPTVIKILFRREMSISFLFLFYPVISFCS